MKKRPRSSDEHDPEVIAITPIRLLV